MLLISWMALGAEQSCCCLSVHCILFIALCIQYMHFHEFHKREDLRWSHAPPNLFWCNAFLSP